MQELKPKTAGEVALKAASLVAGDRDKTHGKKEDNFGKIAAHWNAYLQSRSCDDGTPLDALDVGHMMVLLKIARTLSGSINPDDYIDAAGYAACAGEIAISRLDAAEKGA
jgi:hypothetical protein